MLSIIFIAGCQNSFRFIRKRGIKVSCSFDVCNLPISSSSYYISIYFRQNFIPIVRFEKILQCLVDYQIELLLNVTKTQAMLIGSRPKLQNISNSDVISP